MLTKSQIASGELTDRSLKELFELTNNCSSFLIEAAFDLTHPNTKASTSPSVSFAEPVGGPKTLSQDDQDLIYTKVLFLSSPVNTQDMDKLWEEVS